MSKYNLVDMDFEHLDTDAKRYSFLLMDMKMKKLHDEGKMVLSYEPKDIYFDSDTKLYDYEKVENISPLIVNSPEDAIVYDVIQLSTLAFCSYLPNYDLKNGLLDSGVISQKFDDFSNMFGEIDRDYYKEVFTNTRNTGTLPSPIYYHEYVEKKETMDNSNGKSASLVKATEAGRLMSDNQEAAFGDMFFFATITASMLIGIVGLLIFFLK